jgi:PKD repeat protein
VATFVDNSDENLGGQITAWNWNFGEPTSGTQNFSTLENPVHTYSTPGNFVVTLIITNLNGCSDTIQNTINVKSKPLSNFFSSPGCVNSATQFLADSTVINTGATSIYQWNFGDGATSFSRNVLHTYVAPGTYNVTLTVTDTAGCVGDTVLPVTVNPPPTALFSANTDNCQGQVRGFRQPKRFHLRIYHYLGMEFWRWKYPNRHFPGYAKRNPYLCRNRHVMLLPLR